MLTRTHISAFVGLTIVTWLIALWVQGQPVLSSEFVKPFGIVVGVLVGVSVVFNRWLWSWRWFRGWFVNRPDLRGTWRVTLESDWVNPETNERVPPISGFVVVRQTLMHLTFRLMTPESTSHSISYGITKEADEIFRLAVVYRNEPRIELRGDRSEMHHGAFWLEVFGEEVDSLKGNYWTDRKTRGSMELADRRREYLDSFDRAQQAYSGGDAVHQGQEAG